MKHKELAILKGVSKNKKHSIKITIETVDTLGKANKPLISNFNVVSAICDALEKNYKNSYRIIKQSKG